MQARKLQGYTTFHSALGLEPTVYKYWITVNKLGLQIVLVKIDCREVWASKLLDLCDVMDTGTPIPGAQLLDYAQRLHGCLATTEPASRRLTTTRDPERQQLSLSCQLRVDSIPLTYTFQLFLLDLSLGIPEMTKLRIENCTLKKRLRIVSEELKALKLRKARAYHGEDDCDEDSTATATCAAVDLSLRRPAAALWLDGGVFFPGGRRSYAKYEERKRVSLREFYDLLKLLGRLYSDLMVREGLTRWPFTVTEGKDRSVLLTYDLYGGDITHSVMDMVAFTLEEVLEPVRSLIGSRLESVVLVVPEFMNQAQRQAYRSLGEKETKNLQAYVLSDVDAGRVAFAMHYPLVLAEKQTALLVSLGDTATHVSLLSKIGNTIVVLAKQCRPHISANTVDGKIAQLLTSQLPGPATDRHDKLELRNAAITMRKELEHCGRQSCHHSFSGVASVCTLTLTLEQLNEILILERVGLKLTIEHVLHDGATTAEELSIVVAYGDLSYTHCMQEVVQGFSHRVEFPPRRETWTLDGATIFAAAMSRHPKNKDPRTWWPTTLKNTVACIPVPESLR